MSHGSSKKNVQSADSYRVVLDSNVYVSIFINARSPLATLWQAARTGRYHLITSQWIIQEVASVLRNRFFWDEAYILARLKDIVRHATIVKPASIAPVVLEDPDDDHILACAVAGRADLIVSGDQDLLRLKVYGSISIVRPRDFIRTLGGL